MSILVTAVKNFEHSLDGIHVLHVMAGAQIEMSEAAARSLTSQGFVKVENKSLGGAPSNKGANLEASKLDDQSDEDADGDEADDDIEPKAKAKNKKAVKK